MENVLPLDIERLEHALVSRLQGRIRELRLVVANGGLILQGRARTYHAKQLAQQAAIEETPLPLVANEIEVY